MKIVVNGVWRELPGDEAAEQPPTLARALLGLGYGDRIVATALNGEFVAAQARAQTRIADGDRLEVLAPMQGG